MAIFHCYVSSPEGTQNAQKFLPGFEFGESPRCAGPCATRGHPGRVSLEDSVPTWCGTESGGFGRGPAGAGHGGSEVFLRIPYNMGKHMEKNMRCIIL